MDMSQHVRTLSIHHNIKITIETITNYHRNAFSANTSILMAIASYRHLTLIILIHIRIRTQPALNRTWFPTQRLLPGILSLLHQPITNRSFLLRHIVHLCLNNLHSAQKRNQKLRVQMLLQREMPTPLLENEVVRASTHSLSFHLT
ncbi:hypothetical protein C366_06406 [Cryptococcus neoformans Tu401-1]|nr:hypothetical protein C356_06461 [Cryptococcus neoformans var. grubii c45]OWZ75055.1 hypothetical protein C365_06462 [Cryptococcus neoformans var. grubii Bt85]OXC70131.1 hypothetical protein AYX13_01479 [Cryptococcus neoformans var. grubii]OXG10904.1 hypothetical protein C366_06406 [Cryptococcus neoformans var. grubii Tu401-1]OXM75841.1 hypothetical protein C364_06390 [Cryptococcus neoformans var. grubii Bt63]